MSQSKKSSVIESIANTVSGLVTSFAIQVVIYPILSIPVSIGQNVIITVVFFMASLIRSYIVRRIFNKMTRDD